MIKQIDTNSGIAHHLGDKEMKRMKTKEIECWVRKELPEYLEQPGPLFREPIFVTKPHDHERNCLKARLIIEMPERSVTITESSIDEALRFADVQYDGNDIDGWTKCFKEKLFKSEGV